MMLWCPGRDWGQFLFLEMGGGGQSFASLKGTQGKEALHALTIGIESKIESQHFFSLDFWLCLSLFMVLWCPGL